MGIVTIQSATTVSPLQLIGFEAGTCWGADTSDEEKNRKRGLDCLESEMGGHLSIRRFT